jgi:succinoglycan biosynthesis transport protein ExoP
MDIKEIISPLLKWWWLLVAATLVAAVSTYITVSQQPPMYAADTTLMIGRTIDDPNPNYNDVWLGEQLAGTYADIAGRQPVRQATMDALGLTWLPGYNVRQVNNTQLMVISVQDTDPVRAAAVANELANQLILKSPTNAQQNLERQDFINQQLDDLQVKIQETQDEIIDAQVELQNMISARQIQDAQSQISALQSKLYSLQNNYASLLANSQGGASNTLSIIEPASVPVGPIGSNVSTTVLASAAIGLALAAGAAYLLEYLDNTVKHPDEVKKLTGLPTLAGIAHISGERYREKLITIKHPRSPISEAYRSLRTNIQFATIDFPESKKILVTSPNPTEGKSVTVANLAAVIAQSGNKVLIMDTDLRKPVQHRLFQLPNKTGLTDFLLGVNESHIQDEIKSLINWCIQKTDVEGLHVLASGPLPPNPSELLGSEKMRKTLTALSEIYDYIIMDSPPELIVTDAAVMSSQTDGVLLVVNANGTTRHQLKQAVEELRGLNQRAGLIGVVLNDLSAKRDGYYHNYYYYKRSYYHDENVGYGMEADNGKGGLLSGKFLKDLFGKRKSEADSRKKDRKQKSKDVS